MEPSLLRVVRTLSSERYIVRIGDEDSGCLDLHYLTDGTVQAMFVVFEGSAIRESEIADYVDHFDHLLLPSVSVHDDRLLVTVIVGRNVGAFGSATHITTSAPIN